jgi:hypothetical protein
VAVVEADTELVRRGSRVDLVWLFFATRMIIQHYLLLMLD